MMTREEELERAIEDRNMAEDDIDSLNHEVMVLEHQYPSDFESLDEWNSLDKEITSLSNEVMYLTSCIEDLKYQIAESEEND